MDKMNIFFQTDFNDDLKRSRAKELQNEKKIKNYIYLWSEDEMKVNTVDFGYQVIGLATIKEIKKKVNHYYFIQKLSSTKEVEKFIEELANGYFIYSSEFKKRVFKKEIKEEFQKSGYILTLSYFYSNAEEIKSKSRTSWITHAPGDASEFELIMKEKSRPFGKAEIIYNVENGLLSAEELSLINIDVKKQGDKEKEI